MSNHYNIIIIGGGPIGIACALEARKANIDYLIIEKGCLVNSLYHYPQNMTFFSSSELLELDNIPFVSVNPKPKRNEALEYYRRIAVSRNINIHLFEKVIRLDATELRFKVTTDKGNYTSQYVIIATGFYDMPFMLNVEGENLPKVKHYYDNPHFYAFQKVAVIGAMNSAVDAALETYRKGAHVTMIVRSGQIGERVKYWVRPDIENRIKEGSIKAYFNSEVTRITPETIEIRTPEGYVILENDWVLAMTGYQPNISFLTDCGIKHSRDEIKKPEYNPETYESNVPGIFLAGVVCGGMDTHTYFIENSREHAKTIVAVIKNRIG
ncbi:MAG: YpdA family putative bacillithiol disulfide reductase [Saprospiraceae bacterium]|nr:YpdA family putative bacillithiol disulfide reductase [Saprospiraceae bacterium]